MPQHSWILILFLRSEHMGGNYSSFTSIFCFLAGGSTSSSSSDETVNTKFKSVLDQNRIDGKSETKLAHLLSSSISTSGTSATGSKSSASSSESDSMGPNNALVGTGASSCIGNSTCESYLFALDIMKSEFNYLHHHQNRHHLNRRHQNHRHLNHRHRRRPNHHRNHHHQSEGCYPRFGCRRQSLLGHFGLHHLNLELDRFVVHPHYPNQKHHCLHHRDRYQY
mmetsp:Transcript_27229/g.49461  ORF Transcript_27229/g.49461 Transcript_27229/m.49461 type:complete len:223 (+) Transcript_27229:88-756(+)